MKKTKHIKAFSCLLCIFVGAFILSFTSQSAAATFCVGTSAELQSALTVSGTNSQDDSIQVQQGTYYGNFIYASTESFGVTIEGGYSDALCTVRDVDPDNTVLDGEQNGVVLVLSAPDVAADFAVDGLTLQNGNVNIGGGGLYVVTNGTVTLTNNTISNNNASNNGGGIYLDLSSGTVTLTNNTISNNASAFGGGMYLRSSGTVTLTNNTISNNSGGGGSFFSESSTVTLTNNTISGNYSSASGGGISLRSYSGTVTLTNNTISGNSHSYGSGGGGWFSSEGTFILTNNTISGNSSIYGSCGGIYLTSSGTVTLTNNTISSNSSSSGGGGIGLYSSGTGTLTNNTISGNSASSDGGISLRSYSGTVTLTNNIISGNSSSSGGGGIGLYPFGTVAMTNNIISNNNANNFGGGVKIMLYFDGAIADIYNNIIWNNSAGNEGEDLYIQNDNDNNYFPSTVNLFNNDFDQSADGIYIQIPFPIDPSNLDNADPLFVDPANDNYHLSEDSPCINAGNNSAPELPVTDKDGNPRIIDGIVDMGAYEYQDIPPPSLTVASPNGGEELTAGTTHEITWTSEGDIDNVKIEYSVNNGTDWMEIVDSTENDGSYNWDVPNNPSEQCLLRISDVDSDLSDESDAVFSILPLWYVDGDIAVSGNGTSWSEAFKTIQEAIDAADNGDVIWVKQGTYFITSAIDVDKSVFIYGGFDGTETNKSERNWRTNVTTADGQNTVTCFYLTADATIDGFTIAHGHTNWGTGGMYIDSSSPVVINCTFLENTAGINGGGAINSWNASPIITNSLFLENDGGSAIFNWDCPVVTVTNCTFSGNEGGIFNNNSLMVVTNCILWGDSAYLGSEVYNERGTLTISHCDLSGGMAGVVNAGGGTVNDDGTNLELDPLFSAVYHLQAGSPCINAGDNAALPPDITDLDNDGDTAEPIPLDLDGEPRIVDGVVDMGAYESVYQSPGDELAIDFGALGLWNVDTAGTWRPISGNNVETMAGWANGLAMDFVGTSGVWNVDGTAWSQISGSDAETMVGWAKGLAMDFGALGVWNVDPAGMWTPISGNAETMVGWANGLAMDFGALGVWNVDTAGMWTPISGDAETMAAWTNGLALDFSASGVWNVSAAGTWTPISSSNVETMVGWANGLALDFGASGVWNVDTAGMWTPISGNAETMVGWSNGLAMDFGTWGLWNVDRAWTWKKISGGDVEALTDVDLY